MVLSYGTAVFRAAEEDGNPLAGFVSFAPLRAYAVDAATDPDTAVVVDRKTVPLVAGQLSEPLAVGWWTVSFALTGLTLSSFSFEVTAGATIDLLAVVPVQTVTGQQLAKGDPGEPGPVGLTWRGAWDVGATYLPTDAVQYGGRSFVALTPSTGVAPPTTATSSAEWSLLADKGVDGGGGGAVDSVNGQVGVVVLDAADVGAQPAGTYATPTDLAANSTADRARANHTGTQAAATLSDLTEAVQDIVGALIVAGSGVTVSYDDTAGTFTVNATGATGDTDPEIVRDVIGAALVAGSGIQVTLNDAGDTITIASTAVLPTRQVIAGTGLTGGGDLSTDRTLAVAYGTTAGTAAQGNDSRLSDARTPTAHTHPASQVSDSTTVGRSVLTAADAATARTAIGAGTSNLALGTTSSTAKAGDYAPPSASTTTQGVVELATTGEATTGTDTARAVTPAGVKAVADGKVAAAQTGTVLWRGTQAAYDAIGTKDPSTVYVITA